MLSCSSYTVLDSNLQKDLSKKKHKPILKHSLYISTDSRATNCSFNLASGFEEHTIDVCFIREKLISTSLGRFFKTSESRIKVDTLFSVNNLERSYYTNLGSLEIKIIFHHPNDIMNGTVMMSDLVVYKPSNMRQAISATLNKIFIDFAEYIHNHQNEFSNFIKNGDQDFAVNFKKYNSNKFTEQYITNFKRSYESLKKDDDKRFAYEAYQKQQNTAKILNGIKKMNDSFEQMDYANPRLHNRQPSSTPQPLYQPIQVQPLKKNWTRKCGYKPMPQLGCRIGDCVNGRWEQICN